MKKKKNIVLFSLLGVVIIGFAAFLFFINNKSKVATTQSDYIPNEVASAHVTNAIANDMLDFYSYYIIGEYKAIATDGSEVAFTFKDDGNFKGYTSFTDDDLGEWFLKDDDGEVNLYVRTTETTEKYSLKYNNDENLVITNENGIAFILEKL